MKAIDGVPENIDRSALLTFLSSQGFDIDIVRSLELRPDGVYVTAFWRDPDGKIRRDGDGVIRHRVYVPLVGDQ